MRLRLLARVCSTAFDLTPRAELRHIAIEYIAKTPEGAQLRCFE